MTDFPFVWREPDLDQALQELAAFATKAQHLHQTTASAKPRDASTNQQLPTIQENPWQGTLAELLELASHCYQQGVHVAGPGYLAYIPGGGLFSGAIADFASKTLNAYTGMTAMSPLFAKLEQQVLTWLCQEFDLPETAYGVLTPGGSVANLTALVAGRDWSYNSPTTQVRVYVTNHCHHSIAKACHTSGIRHHDVITIATRDDLAMDPVALEQAIKRDRRAGYHRGIIVASAGTTNTGTIDPLKELANIRDRYQCWLHVDGAYGGAFQLCPRGRQRLMGISSADSITIDPHKGLFLPYGNGALLVADKQHLQASFGQEATYLDRLHQQDHLQPPDPATLGIELSRPNRGFGLWLPLVLHGADAFRQALDSRLKWAQQLAQQLAQSPNLDIWPTSLSIIPLRFRSPTGASQSEQDQHQLLLLERLNHDGRFHISSTVINQQRILRIAILSFRTSEQTLQMFAELILAASEQLQRQLAE